MARIHDTITIGSGNAMPSLGVLTGSRVSNEVFNSINNGGHRSFFGEDFGHLRQEFFSRYVAPMDQLGLDISRTVNAIMNPDNIRILSTIDDFKTIPLRMEIPILMYEPVLKAVREGRMEGFGWDSDWLPTEDVYGRLIENFTCHDVLRDSDEDGWYDISGTSYTDDPDLTDDELYQ